MKNDAAKLRSSFIDAEKASKFMMRQQFFEEMGGSSVEKKRGQGGHHDFFKPVRKFSLREDGEIIKKGLEKVRVVLESAEKSNEQSKPPSSSLSIEE